MASRSNVNYPPFMNNPPKNRGKKNGTKSSSRGKRSTHKNTPGSSGNRSGTAEMVNGLASGSQHRKLPVGTIIGNKRVHYNFELWAYEEKTIMDRELEKFAGNTSLTRLKICEKIAKFIPHKSIRDVSMRIQHLIKYGKVDENLNRIRNDNQGNESVPVGQLLQKNAQILGQICSNLRANKISDNIELLRQSWDNIETMLNHFNINPGIMENMPPVPVQINQEFFNLVLPQTKSPKGTMNPDMIVNEDPGISALFPINIFEDTGFPIKMNPDMIVNEDPGNSALFPINIFEDTGFPIKMTHMQSSTVGRMDEELSKLSFMPDNIWEEPFNQSITELVPASPGGNLDDYNFYLPDNPDDPDLVTIRKMLSAQAVEGSRG